MNGQRCPAQARGTSMIEVLVTIVIVAVGMLGMAGLQSRAHSLEFESYQRGQALILLQDMLDRINNSDSANAAGYVTASALGTGATDATDCTTLTSRAAIDLCEWSKALKGSAEAATNTAGAAKQGAMLDGRGCVTQPSGTTNTYLVAVVWQGMTATVPPVSTCGQGSYSSESSRRVVSATVVLPDLGAN